MGWFGVHPAKVVTPAFKPVVDNRALVKLTPWVLISPRRQDNRCFQALTVGSNRVSLICYDLGISAGGGGGTTIHVCSSFHVPELPDDVLTRIISLRANNSVVVLRPFVRAGGRTRRLVYTPTVLRNCNFHPLFFRDPDSILNHNGRARHIFEAAIREGNQQAVYFESLNRVVIHEDYDGGFSMLDEIAPTCLTGALASAILCVCLGHTTKASEMFQLFTNLTGIIIYEANARAYGDQVSTNIFWLSRKAFNMYISDSFQFPNDDHIHVPDCTYDHMFTLGCNRCYMHRLGLRVCTLLTFVE
ncbi:unnamed protein product [Microthlaspi erraticum]|uniref:Uncharacterized protein n=1 Tax=Microthlaspi erraticum TaxID=1685480 RepID=A0A6D2K2F1_9BRAS|nr:unnamed protein product [Microthlaspi erraticum]